MFFCIMRWSAQRRIQWGQSPQNLDLQLIIEQHLFLTSPISQTQIVATSTWPQYAAVAANQQFQFTPQFGLANTQLELMQSNGLTKCHGVQVKLIAEPWDCGGLYQVGGFPNWDVWGEWNGKFRDDIR